MLSSILVLIFLDSNDYVDKLHVHVCVFEQFEMCVCVLSINLSDTQPQNTERFLLHRVDDILSTP